MSGSINSPSGKGLLMKRNYINGMRGNTYNGGRGDREFSFRKLDIVTREGLAGAVFELEYPDGVRLTAESDASGRVRFMISTCVTYRLREILQPVGYEPMDTVFTVCMDACGGLCVDGLPTRQLTLYNERAAILSVFRFNKVSASTGLGIGGAAFMLTSGGEVYATAESDAAGLVDFGPVSPGVYQLRETEPPAGYAPNEAVFSVIVTADGVITVAGMPPENFRVEDLPIAEVNTRTVTGTVYPVVYNDQGLGLEFLEMFNTDVELRGIFGVPASESLSTVAMPINMSGAGEFTIENVPFGSYILKIKRPGYLARSLLVTVTPESPDVIELAPPGTERRFNLWAGDVNGDGIVDAADMSIITSLLGVGVCSEGYDPAADLNADGVIDNSDILLALKNLGRTAADYPGAEDISLPRP